MQNVILNQSKSLSRRERQIMDILYESNPSSAQDIQSKLVDPPSYSAVRALLARMVDKSLVKFEQDGAKYMYSPVAEERQVQSSALHRLLKIFFKGSRVNAVTALLDLDGEDLNSDEIKALERKIAQVKRAQKK